MLPVSIDIPHCMHANTFLLQMYKVDMFTLNPCNSDTLLCLSMYRLTLVASRVGENCLSCCAKGHHPPTIQPCFGEQSQCSCVHVFDCHNALCCYVSQQYVTCHFANADTDELETCIHVHGDPTLYAVTLEHTPR